MNKTNLIHQIQSIQKEKHPSLASFIAEAWAMIHARLSLLSANHTGQRIRLWGRLVVSNHGQLWIGDRVRLKGLIVPIELTTGTQGRLEIGDRTFINYGCSIAAEKFIHIGADCSIGPYTNIIDNAFHQMDPERRNIMPESEPVIIEDNVWIGTRSIILPGVTIGKDSVIGAGSVVTRDIPPRSVAAGVPAKVLRSL